MGTLSSMEIREEVCKLSHMVLVSFKNQLTTGCRSSRSCSRARPRQDILDSGESVSLSNSSFGEGTLFFVCKAGDTAGHPSGCGASRTPEEIASCMVSGAVAQGEESY